MMTQNFQAKDRAVNAERWAAMKALRNFSNADTERVATLKSFIERDFDEFQQAFFQAAFQSDEFRKYFTTEESVEAFKLEQKRILFEMLQGPHDETYAARRGQVWSALCGQESSLGWRASSAQNLLAFFTGKLAVMEGFESLVKLVFLEQDLIGESFVPRSEGGGAVGLEDFRSFLETLKDTSHNESILQSALAGLMGMGGFSAGAVYIDKSGKLEQLAVEPASTQDVFTAAGEGLCVQSEGGSRHLTSLPFEAKRHGFNQSVSLSLSIEGEHKAHFVLLSREPKALPPESILGLETGAQLVRKLVLAHAHGHDQAEKDTEFFSRVLKEGWRAGSEQELMRLFVSTFLEFWGFDYGAFWQVDRDAATMSLGLEAGERRGLRMRADNGQKQVMGEGLAGRAWATREVVLEHFSGSAQKSAATGLSFPLFLGSQVGGVVEFWASRRIQFAPLRVRALENLARTASLLLVNVERKIDAEARAIAVSEVARVLSLVAQGDLTEEVEGEFEGDLELLQTAIGRSVRNLKEIVTETLEASLSVTQAANEIAQGNADLSQRTERQAMSLEKTAETLRQLTTTVWKNANNAFRSSELANQARSHAEEGGAVIAEATRAMQSIRDTSQQISDILGVMDEIAFQTNLLALNAAVEAARAGEQGRGFAVVATEVRSLAQRSATAAKEIKALIRSSMDQVGGGVQLVSQSSEALQRIVESNTSQSEFAAQIAVASKEQSTGLSEISKGVGQLEQATQQNAALVEESATAAESLSSQAEHLQQIMGFFKVSEVVHPTSIIPAVPKPPVFKSAERPAVPEAVAPSGEHWEEF